LRLFWIFLLVRFIVEVAEEEVEHYGVYANPPNEDFWIIAIDEKQLESMDYHEDKLNHLQSSQIFLPPQIWSYLRPKRCQEIIEVHYDVYESVQTTREATVTT